jgi:hypothetical protein
MNGSETDVDCGGTTCKGCEIGQKCAVTEDCAASQCYLGACEP